MRKDKNEKYKNTKNIQKYKFKKYAYKNTGTQIQLQNYKENKYKIHT